jgi:hypothetical protein
VIAIWTAIQIARRLACNPDYNSYSREIIKSTPLNSFKRFLALAAEPLYALDPKDSESETAFTI